MVHYKVTSYNKRQKTNKEIMDVVLNLENRYNRRSLTVALLPVLDEEDINKLFTIIERDIKKLSYFDKKTTENYCSFISSLLHKLKREHINK